MKRPPRIHRKDEKRVVWQASRLEGKVKNIGIKPIKKAGQAQKKVQVPSKRVKRKRT